MSRAALLALALLALGGCGQKGPLYLPEKTATVIRPATSPPATAPASAPDAAAVPAAAPAAPSAPDPRAKPAPAR